MTVFVEGEEEFGSPSLADVPRARTRDQLAPTSSCSPTRATGRSACPALTTSLRGLVECVVEVRTLDHAVHSGMYGGAVPRRRSPRCAGCSRTLHDDAGDVAVAGLSRARPTDLDLTEEQLRADAGVLDGVELIGTGPLTSRLWTKPALTVVGIDVPSTGEASNTLRPQRAGQALDAGRARAGRRTRPSRPCADAPAAHAPVGRAGRGDAEETGQPFAADADGPAYDAARAAFADAWGVRPVDMGIGGSIPFIAEFAAIFPDAAILVTGVEDPDTRAHGADESLHLGEFERVCLAEAVLLERLATLPR